MEASKHSLANSIKKQSLGLSPQVGRSRAAFIFGGKRNEIHTNLEAKVIDSSFKEKITLSNNTASLKLFKQMVKESIDEKQR